MKFIDNIARILTVVFLVALVVGGAMIAYVGIIAALQTP